MKNMKKILCTLTTLELSTIAGISTIACGSGDSSGKNTTYNSIDDAIRALNLNSYIKTNSTSHDTIMRIRDDIIDNLELANYAKGIDFDYKKIKLNSNQVINKKTSKEIADSDLKQNGKLNLDIRLLISPKK